MKGTLFRIATTVLVVFAITIIFAQFDGYPQKSHDQGYLDGKSQTSLTRNIRDRRLFYTADKCHLQNMQQVVFNFTEKDTQSIVITINASGRSKLRLCNLVASLEAQVQLLNATIDINVFSDEPLDQDILCGQQTKVFIWEVKSQHDRYFTKLKPLWEHYSNATNHGGVQYGWFFFIDDDSLVILHNLLQVVKSHHPNELTMIGGTSESSASLQGIGAFPFGGGGILLSRSTLVTMLPSLPCCIKMLSIFPLGGDEKLARCGADLGVSFTPHGGFHQVDYKGRLEGFFETEVARTASVVTLHHFYHPGLYFYPIWWWNKMDGKLRGKSTFPSLPPQSLELKSLAVKQLMLGGLTLPVHEHSNFMRSVYFYSHHGVMLSGANGEEEVVSIPWTLQWCKGYSVVIFLETVPFNAFLFHSEQTHSAHSKHDVAWISPRKEYLTMSSDQMKAFDIYQDNDVIPSFVWPLSASPIVRGVEESAASIVSRSPGNSTSPMELQSNQSQFPSTGVTEVAGVPIGGHNSLHRQHSLRKIRLPPDTASTNPNHHNNENAEGNEKAVSDAGKRRLFPNQAQLQAQVNPPPPSPPTVAVRHRDPQTASSQRLVERPRIFPPRSSPGSNKAADNAPDNSRLVSPDVIEASFGNRRPQPMSAEQRQQQRQQQQQSAPQAAAVASGGAADGSQLRSRTFRAPRSISTGASTASTRPNPFAINHNSNAASHTRHETVTRSSRLRQSAIKSQAPAIPLSMIQAHRFYWSCYETYCLHYHDQLTAFCPGVFSFCEANMSAHHVPAPVVFPYHVYSLSLDDTHPAGKSSRASASVKTAKPTTVPVGAAPVVTNHTAAVPSERGNSTTTKEASMAQHHRVEREVEEEEEGAAVSHRPNQNPNHQHHRHLAADRGVNRKEKPSMRVLKVLMKVDCPWERTSLKAHYNLPIVSLKDKASLHSIKSVQAQFSTFWFDRQSASTNSSNNHKVQQILNDMYFDKESRQGCIYLIVD